MTTRHIQDVMKRFIIYSVIVASAICLFTSCSKDESHNDSEYEYAYLFRKPLQIPTKYKAIIGSWVGKTDLCIHYYETYLEDGTMIYSIRHHEPHGDYHNSYYSACKYNLYDSDSYQEYRIHGDTLIIKRSDGSIYTVTIKGITSTTLTVLGTQYRVNSVPPINYYW